MSRVTKNPSHKPILAILRKQWSLQAIILIGLIYLIIFSYTPMVGIIIAFKSFKLSTGVIGFFTSPWVGLKWFNEFVTDYMFVDIIRNTVVLSALKIFIAFPLPIIFALMVNEIRRPLFKRFVQTSSYLPHFISWIIVTGLVFTMFSTVNGLINELLLKFHLVEKAVPILTDAKYYWNMAIFSEIWKEVGWRAIIFIAAISGVDAAMYEAAEIDGASRLQRIWHITLPSIRGTIVIMLILSMSGLVNGNLEQARLLGNTINRERSDIIQSYVLRVGLVDFRFDYAAAVGLMQSVISVILVFGSNWLSRKISGDALY